MQLYEIERKIRMQMNIMYWGSCCFAVYVKILSDFFNRISCYFFNAEKKSIEI